MKNTLLGSLSRALMALIRATFDSGTPESMAVRAFLTAMRAVPR